MPQISPEYLCMEREMTCMKKIAEDNDIVKLSYVLVKQEKKRTVKQ